MIAQLSQINPDFEQLVLNVSNSTKVDMERAAESKLGTKEPKYNSHYCFGPWALARSLRIYQGTLYLDGLKDTPTMAPGPRECARVSCSWDSAIWWCSDVRATHPSSTSRPYSISNIHADCFDFI